MYGGTLISTEATVFRIKWGSDPSCLSIFPLVSIFGSWLHGYMVTSTIQFREYLMEVLTTDFGLLFPMLKRLNFMSV